MSRKDTDYAVMMLLSLKEAALNAELGDTTERTLSKAAGGCGMFVIASHIDDFVKTFLDYQTALADYKFRYELAHGIEKQWEELGFPENPEDMDGDTIEELKTIAKKHYGEDEEG